jgi:SNF2 family DNA or RNA helicase
MNRFHRAPSIQIEKKLVHHMELAEQRLKGKLIAPYQPAGVRFLILKELTGPGCILADDMGLGKTVMTVAFLLAMHEPGQLPTLVVAPKSVCQQWKDEVEKFSSLRCELYDRTSMKDPKAIQSNIDVLVVSFSFFMRESCTSSSLMESKFHRVILDEAHLIKNPNTVSSRHIKQLDCVKRLCLSGTPIQNDPKDLFSLVKWIFQDGCSSGSSDNLAQKRLDNILGSSRSKSKAAMMHCTEYIRNNILLRRTLDDVALFNPNLELPQLTVRVVSVPFADPNEAMLYQHVEEIAKERIKNVLKQYNTQSNMDILEALLRCRQVCIHHKLFVDAVSEQSSVHAKWKVPAYALERLPMRSTKISTLVNMIAAHPTDKTLIFCSFVKEMRAIQEALNDSLGISSLLYYGDMSNNERNNVLDSFKDPAGDHTVLIIQMNAGGTGLNLQVANRCYVTSPAYNPSLELQCIARSHRTGQTKQVSCIRLVMQDTVEEKILDIQKKKLDMIAQALDDQRITTKLNHDHVQLSTEDICHLFHIQKSEIVQDNHDHDECQKEGQMTLQDLLQKGEEEVEEKKAQEHIEKRAEPSSKKGRDASKIPEESKTKRVKTAKHGLDDVISTTDGKKRGSIVLQNKAVKTLEQAKLHAYTTTTTTSLCDVLKLDMSNNSNDETDNNITKKKNISRDVYDLDAFDDIAC